MAQDARQTIGQRIAYYRKLNGMRAVDLADLAGSGLSRSVIANIENGRRADLTVGQMLSVAAVLGIPPLALIVDIEAPFSSVTLPDDTNPTMQVANAIEWIAGRFELGVDRTPAGNSAYRVLAALEQLRHAETRLWSAQYALSAQKEGEVIDEYKLMDLQHMPAQIDLTKSYLRELGVDIGPADG